MIICKIRLELSLRCKPKKTQITVRGRPHESFDIIITFHQDPLLERSTTYLQTKIILMLESVLTREQPKYGCCLGFLYKFSLECLRLVRYHLACHTYYAGHKNSCLLHGLTAVHHYAHAPLCSCLPPNISYFICLVSVIAILYFLLCQSRSAQTTFPDKIVNRNYHQ